MISDGYTDIDKILDVWKSEAETLPKLSTDPLKWIEENRPLVEAQAQDGAGLPFLSGPFLELGQ